MRGRSIGAAGIALTALLVSAGCTSEAFPDQPESAAAALLDRAQTDVDRLDDPRFASSDLDPTTTRLIGSQDGVSYLYAIAPEADDGRARQCLIAVPERVSDWMAVCGSGQGTGSSIGYPDFRYDFEGFDPEDLGEDEVAVGDYVIAVLDE